MHITWKQFFVKLTCILPLECMEQFKDENFMTSKVTVKSANFMSFESYHIYGAATLVTTIEWAL